MRWIKLGLWVLFTFSIMTVLVVVIGQNQEPMSVTLFSAEIEPQPKWLVLASCVLIGALVSSIFFIVSLVVLETKNIRLARNNRKLMRALEKAGLAQNGHKGSESSLELGPAVGASAGGTPLIDDDSDV